jgi:hypothetical protein
VWITFYLLENEILLVGMEMSQVYGMLKKVKYYMYISIVLIKEIDINEKTRPV